MPQIIQLERTGMPSDNNFRMAFWLDVEPERQAFYANPAATSAFKGITTTELDAIKSGAVVEVIETIDRPAGGTLAEFRAEAQLRLTRLQNELTNRNPYNRYGTRFNGTSWTTVTVA